MRGLSRVQSCRTQSFLCRVELRGCVVHGPKRGLGGPASANLRHGMGKWRNGAKLRRMCMQAIGQARIAYPYIHLRTYVKRVRVTDTYVGLE
eukprot:33218-Eustigmatos_ZCMA.PRE.1